MHKAADATPINSHQSEGQSNGYLSGSHLTRVVAAFQDGLQPAKCLDFDLRCRALILSNGPWALLKIKVSPLQIWPLAPTMPHVFLTAWPGDWLCSACFCSFSFCRTTSKATAGCDSMRFKRGCLGAGSRARNIRLSAHSFRSRYFSSAASSAHPSGGCLVTTSSFMRRAWFSCTGCCAIDWTATYRHHGDGPLLADWFRH